MVHLYSSTLQRPSCVSHAVCGSFSAPKLNEIITVRNGRVLELFRPDDNSRLQLISSTDVFGIIRSIASFRLVGANRDYLVVGSDSGRIIILEYNTSKSSFQKVHQETFGRTGCRRSIAGQYVAVDPKGRAVMIAAIEKQKFVYVLNRDSAARLTISSPLEAHKSKTITHSVVALDMGFDNPMFACLEVNYEDPSSSSKVLTYYSMDLGLNHVMRKASEVVPSSAHMLIAVPGTPEGPSGVIVCCENHIIYKKMDHPDVVCALPRRLEMSPERSLFIINSMVIKLKGFFYILLQSELGDLYKVDMNLDPENTATVPEIDVSYFDTVPPGNAMTVLKSGYLFVGSESGNNLFYQFTSLESSESVRTSSSHPLGRNAIVAFKPHKLKNLELQEEAPSNAPLCKMLVADVLGEGTPQIYNCIGKGSRSTLRILKHGIDVSEIACNELPGTASGIFSVRESYNSEYDRLIVISFKSETLVLSIGETVEECEDSGLLTDVKTIFTQMLADDSIIQVYPSGFRHWRKGNNSQYREWRAPPQRPVVHATGNGRQIFLSLSGGYLILFELDEHAHHLAEVSQREAGSDVTCISVQPLPEGKIRSSFAAIGLTDDTVRIISIEPHKALKQLSAQSLPSGSSAESVCIIPVTTKSSTLVGGNEGNSPSGTNGSNAYLVENETVTWYLNIGCANGILLRAVLDSVVGTLSDQRSRFLGPKAVRLSMVSFDGYKSLLALSSRPWINYMQSNALHCVPLNSAELDYATPLSSSHSKHSIVAVGNDMLRIFMIDKLGERFSHTVLPLQYTPRGISILPALSNEPGELTPRILLAIVEADHNAYDINTTKDIRSALDSIQLDNAMQDEDGQDASKNMFESHPEEQEKKPLPENLYGSLLAGEGKWGSCIRIVDPKGGDEGKGSTASLLALEADEAALCCTSVVFEEYTSAPLLVVGVAKEMNLATRSCSSAEIRVFLIDHNKNLNLLHSTPVEAPPTSLCAFHGRLMVSIGNHVRMYSLGKKRLLRKCEYKNLPEAVAWMKSSPGNDFRLFLGDVRSSVHVLKYRHDTNQMIVMTDDILPRYCCAGEVLDTVTCMGSDKFDNVFVLRIPPDALAEGSLEGGARLKMKGDTQYITGQTPKFDLLCHFHVGETVMSLQKTKLNLGAAECILAATIGGSLIAFTPLSSKEDIDFLQSLEMLLRGENDSQPLCGRDHLAFRSYYNPVHNVIDGDFCEKYLSLTLDKQRSIAGELDKTPNEIIKKLEDLRTKIL